MIKYDLLPKFEHREAYFAEMPRLAVYEIGVHYLDTFRFLFGEPETLFARSHRVSPDVVGEDVQLIAMNYEDMTCLINHSWASVPLPGVDRPEEDHNPRDTAHGLEIDGTKGTLTLKPDRTLHLHSDSDHQQWQFPPDSIRQSRIAAQQHFINCLESGAEFETSGADTLKTMTLVNACYLSGEEGRVVRL